MIRNQAAWLRAAACVTVAGLVLAGCGQKSNTGTPATNTPVDQGGFPETADIPLVEGKPGGTFRFGITEPTAIDPYNVQESEGHVVEQALFTGLAKTDFAGKVTPAVAEKWETNDDCSQWTFPIKRGTKFHNGEEVTSASFKRGWERTAAKSAASGVAYHLDQIDGYEALHGGTATTFSGVDATDPGVLKVKLAKPSCEFYIRTVAAMFSPVPSVAGGADNKTYNDLPIGNGPFMMDGPWLHDKGIKLKRFDGYTVDKKANLDAVEITITSAENGYQEEYDGFNNGTFDFARMPTDVLSKARAANEPKGKWLSKRTASTSYLLVMVTKKPLDTPKARKAVSMAIDRKLLTENVLQNSVAPATALLPPGFKDAYQPGVCGACTLNVDEAKKLAQEAGLTPGTELNFQFNAGGAHEGWTNEIKQELEKTLGLKVKYSGVPFDDMLKNERQPDASGMYRSRWGADYPTPSNFLQPLLSTSAIGAADANSPAEGDNKGRYSNKAFDDLLDKAARTKDEAERNNVYKEAEKLAIGEDLALIPIYVSQQHRLISTDKYANIRFNFFEDPDLPLITLK